MISKQHLRSLINEELTKNEVKDIVKKEMESNFKGKEFEKMVRKITVEVMEQLHKVMYINSSMWKNLI